MTSIIPFARSQGTRALDVRPLAWALERMTPGLWDLIHPGESFEDALTRREAARDVLDELLAEARDELAGLPADCVGVAW